MPKRMWAEYLEAFHARNPGITEDVLLRSTNGGLNPYQWLAQSLPARGRVLDLACGSAPIFEVREWEEWVGLDRSDAELAKAGERGAAPLIKGDATSLPFPSASFQAVVCSMAIMLLQPLDIVLSEIHRVLVPGGTAAFMLPGSRPLTAGDLLFYGRLMVSLRQSHLAYPNDRRLARMGHVFRASGFELASDERVGFSYTFDDNTSARRFVDSLYLPSATASRVNRAYACAERRIGGDVGVPLRRVIVRSAPST